MSQETASTEEHGIAVLKAGAAERAAFVAAVNRAVAEEDAIARKIAIFKEGVNLTGRLRLADGTGWFTPMVRDFLGQGVSMVVNHIAPSAPVARAVERVTGIPADWVFQHNLYITPRDIQGFVPHCDAHVVAIAHLYGRKEWFIYDKRQDNPVILNERKDVLVADPKEELPIRQRILVEPGDVFVIPRGTYHGARAVGGSSVHVAIGCAGIRPVDVLWALAGHAMAQSSLRADMEPDAARAAAEAFVASVEPPLLALPREPLEETDVPAEPPALSFEEALRVP